MSSINQKTQFALTEARDTLEQVLKQGTLLLKNLDMQIARTASEPSHKTSSLSLNEADAADYARRIAGFGVTLTDAGNAIRAWLPKGDA